MISKGPENFETKYANKNNCSSIYDDEEIKKKDWSSDKRQQFCNEFLERTKQMLKDDIAQGHPTT